jgi:uncharacterized protein with FMN-binding domain
MKLRLSVLLSVLLLIALPGCTGTPGSSPSASPGASGAGIYNPGTYSAKAQGYRGEVTVTLTVDGNNITDVSIDGSDETPEVGGAALDTLAENIKKANSDQIDGVSGATVTSDAVKEATAAALADAKR